MKSNNIQFIGIGLLCLAQLTVFGNMIFQNEDITKTGEVFKFRVKPIDPTDPFRGKYVTLQFEDNTYPEEWDSSYVSEEHTFVYIINDDSGYAKINFINGRKINKGERANMAYLKLSEKTLFSHKGGINVKVSFPFNRYYMEESKAPKAEKALRNRANSSEPLEAYALVAIKNGKGVLLDVVVEGMSIKDYVNH
ncbi:MAG: GDYXXLXY domain-containing protein [Bacteroidia bacterium]|nr:GDYXXLXY domain-containing protein [Bacteroidia bacterium]